MENRRLTARAPVVIPVASLISLVVILWLTGVPVVTSSLLALLVAWQSLGGILVWRSIRGTASLLELLGMGIAIGTALAAIAGLTTATAGLGPWGSLLPTAAVLVAAFLRRANTRVGSTPVDQWTLWALLATVAAGLGVFLYALRSYPLSWTGSWTGYHPDMAFFEALANSLARFGVLESPFMSGATVRYHWLSYAWTGQLSVMSEAEPFVGVTRVLPLVALLASAAIVVAWTQRLSENRWTPFLAGALLTMSGFVGAVFGGVLTLDSPSQAMSVVWLLAFTLTAVHVLESAQSPGAMVLLIILGVAITLGKVSAAAPGLAAVLLAAAVLAIRRSLSPSHALMIAATTAIPIGATFLIFLAGSTGGGGLTIGSLIDRASSQQGLNPLDGPRGVLLGTGILVLAVVPRWAGVVQLIIDKSWRWRAETWVSIGLVGSSITALVLFNGFNEIWFSASVSGPLAVTSAVGARVAVSALQTRSKPTTTRLIGATTVGAMLVFLLVWWAWSTGASGGNVFVTTQRWLGPLIAWIGAILLGIALATSARKAKQPKAVIAGTVLVLVFIAVPGRFLGVGSNQIGILDNGIRNEWFDVAKTNTLITIDESIVIDWTSPKMDAAKDLRGRALPTDLVASNLTLGPFVAGVTQLPTYVSAIPYQNGYGQTWVSAELLDREREVWSFLTNPNLSSFNFICANNIRWLWVDKERTDQRSWEPFASPVFENSEVILAKIEPSQCP